jgi:hypothetical protein
VVLDTAIGKLHRERGREWAVIALMEGSEVSRYER